MDFDYMFKFIIIGDSSNFFWSILWDVGKSCLLSRINNNSFKEHHEVTLGVDIATKFLKI